MRNLGLPSKNGTCHLLLKVTQTSQTILLHSAVSFPLKRLKLTLNVKRRSQYCQQFVCNFLSYSCGDIATPKRTARKRPLHNTFPKRRKKLGNAVAKNEVPQQQKKSIPVLGIEPESLALKRYICLSNCAFLIRC